MGRSNDSTLVLVQDTQWLDILVAQHRHILSPVGLSTPLGHGELAAQYRETSIFKRAEENWKRMN